MRLVRLDDGCYVNPEDVQEIITNHSVHALIVRMRNGVGHSVTCDYGKTAFTTAERIKAELEGRPELIAAATDALSGWRYLRKHHGDLPGVAWDRVETALTESLAPPHQRR